MKHRTRIGLDHVGIAVGELGAVSAIYERLGFRLTPEQRQSGPVRPGEQPTSWGTANRCAMLRQGYIELLGIVDPALYDNQLRAFLARGEGAHILALSVENAGDELARLAGSGFPGLEIRPLIRSAAIPGGERQVGFLRIPLPVSNLHGGRVQLIEHLSAEVIWQPSLLHHPNHVTGLVEVVLRVEDLDAASDLYRSALAAEPVPDAGGAAARLGLATGDLVLATPEGCRRLFPEFPLPPGPDFVAFGVRTDDGGRALRRVLNGAAVPFREREGRIVLAPEHAGGALLWVE